MCRRHNCDLLHLVSSETPAAQHCYYGIPRLHRIVFMHAGTNGADGYLPHFATSARPAPLPAGMRATGADGASERSGVAPVRIAWWARAFNCIGGTLFSGTWKVEREHLQEMQQALEAVCAAVVAAEESAVVEEERPAVYVRPPLFRQVVRALWHDRRRVFVIHGAPALGKTALAQEIQGLINSGVRRQCWLCSCRVSSL